MGTDEDDALQWLLARLQENGEIRINAMRSLYLHESRVPDKPTLLTR